MTAMARAARPSKVSAWVELEKIGKKAPIMMTKMEDASESPTIATESGIQAMGGIGRVTPKIASSKWRVQDDRYEMNDNRKASAIAKTNPTKTRAKLAPRLSQKFSVVASDHRAANTA